MPIIVQKFGGSSVANPEKILRAARRAIRAQQEGNQVVMVVSAMGDTTDDLLDLDDALTRLAAEEPDKARLVQLRFFAGLSTPDAAAALGISVATAERWWAYARAWLFGEIQDDEKNPRGP